MGRLRLETFPEIRRLGPRARQSHIDHTEPRWKSTGPVEIQKPTADPATLRADGDLMKETPVLGLGAVQGQQLL
jgi:hypothetical protein